ncbi:MAG: 1-deoxy-D-xylulose-5-phosphate synthase [Deltaproteobacteria bacterium]|nr:1-deoxy-D-xylulose-5-phosphate synthase [Deltaproteobacteria bacterium]
MVPPEKEIICETIRLLDCLNGPEDLKRLSLPELKQLAEEIRRTIIETVSKNGGHLAPNLGVVELTLALHRVFNSPEDKIVWDVGHQCYTHKLLTGRRDRFSTLRQLGGLSGFPKREESPHDAFDTGHSGTSISAALGLAVAKELKQAAAKVIAVIGDGSLTAGEAFEGLNQAGHLGKDLIVVLNDNEMSISNNVGALSSFLSKRLTGKSFVQFKREIESLFKSIPGIGEPLLQWAKKSEDSITGFFTPGMLFSALHFDYVGPVRGHRLEALIETFENLRHLQAPVLVHVLTTKGQGYPPAEKNPTHFHGVGPFRIDTGEPCQGPVPSPPTYTRVFGDTVLALAEKDLRVVTVTAAMTEGTGLEDYARRFPGRFFDVGIAEQHAVTFAAGMAAEGLRPIVAIYSTFLQRAYDQVLHDVCLPNLPVLLAMDRGGIVGEDGPTHQGVFDLSYLRHLPNLTLMVPKDEKELRNMLIAALDYEGPTAIRYPRGAGVGVPLDGPIEPIRPGKWEQLQSGAGVALIALGPMVQAAREAAERLEAEGLRPAVINARFVKPMDEGLIKDLAARYPLFITVEENILQGGFGSGLLETCQRLKIQGLRIRCLGLPDCFVPHGSPQELRRLFGLDAEGIMAAVREERDESSAD